MRRRRRGLREPDRHASARSRCPRLAARAPRRCGSGSSAAPAVRAPRPIPRTQRGDRRGRRGSRPRRRRGRSDRFVLLAGVGRDPHRDPRSVRGQPDPPSTRVLAVVVREVLPDPLLEPLLAERPAEHGLGVERASRRIDDDIEVCRRGGADVHRVPEVSDRRTCSCRRMRIRRPTARSSGSRRSTSRRRTSRSGASRARTRSSGIRERRRPSRGAARRASRRLSIRTRRAAWGKCNRGAYAVVPPPVFGAKREYSQSRMTATTMPPIHAMPR